MVHPWLQLRIWQRHSLVLTVAGLCYIAIGASYLIHDPDGPRAKSLVVVLEHAPMEFWAGIFMVVGMLAILSSRWPLISELWGYAVLTGLSGGWAAAFATGIFLVDRPMANVSSTITWTIVAFLWWSISGLLNPARVVLVVVEDEPS